MIVYELEYVPKKPWFYSKKYVIFNCIVAFLLIFQLIKNLSLKLPDVKIYYLDQTEIINKEKKIEKNKTLTDPNYCFVPNIITRNIPENSDRISLILHISHDRLKPSIIRQIENWDGPISLAIVFPYDIPSDSLDVGCTAHFLKVLQNNQTHAKNKLSAHFLIQNFTKNDEGEANCGTKENFPETTDSDLESAICDVVYKNFSNSEKIKKMVNYPVNEARNFARKMTSTNYILVADMDHFFSKNFEGKMLSLAKRELSKDPKVALTYRIFELANDVENYPKTKADLIELFKTKKAQVFHKSYGAHAIPLLNKWFKEPENDGNDTTIQFINRYKSSAWEPQFVSLRDIPIHDTNFLYPQRDNTVLRWEMCRAGYKFAIINDVYMFHPGIKSPKESNLVQSARWAVNKRTQQAIQSFRQRMTEIYPETEKICPNFKL